MIVQEYFIENRWFAAPKAGHLKLGVRHRETTTEQTQRTLVQVVRPPRYLKQETSIKLREAWNDGVYFPSIWQAQPGIYKGPHVIVVASESLIAIQAKHKHPHAASCQYVALVEDENETLRTVLHNIDPRPSANILGVFRRCE